LLGIVGLSVDTAYFFSEKRALQGAADLAALVGSTNLSDSSTLASAAALANATSNGYTHGVAGDSVAVVTPYNGEAAKIEVTIERAVKPYFLKVFGFGSINVSARAVAIHQAKHYAVYAGSTDCRSGVNAIDFSGSNISISGGDVHSNARFKVPGSDTSLAGAASYVCETDVSGSRNTFGSGPTATSIKPFPITFQRSDFSCTYTWPGDADLNQEGDWWVDHSPSSKILKPGVYCATGKISLSGSDISGDVTFVTSGITDLSGSNFALIPYRKDVLLFSTNNGDDAVKLAGSGGNWQGYRYAPNGSIELSGSGNQSIKGSIIANKVTFSGSDLSIIADGAGRRIAHLIE